MYFFIAILVTIFGRCVDAQHRTQPPTSHPCFSKDLCNGFTDPNVYHAYQPDDQYFFSCFQWDLGSAGIVVFNMGCQVCPNRDTYWSEKCQDCLSRKDVQQQNCSDAGVVSRGNNNNPPILRSCPPANSCSGRANGTYRLSETEKSTFYSCVAGAETQCQDCPPGLIYVEVCGSCEYNDTKNPADCPAKPTGGTSLDYCDSTICNSKDDGFYEKQDATSEYYACTEGTCIKRQCPKNAGVFAQVCGKCVETYTKIASQCPQQAPFTPAVLRFCDPLSFCKGKADGNYEAKPTRQNYYYACNFGLCTRQECQPNLVFIADSQGGRCDFV